MLSSLWVLSKYLWKESIINTYIHIIKTNKNLFLLFFTNKKNSFLLPVEQEAQGLDIQPFASRLELRLMGLRTPKPPKLSLVCLVHCLSLITTPPYIPWGTTSLTKIKLLDSRIYRFVHNLKFY